MSEEKQIKTLKQEHEEFLDKMEWPPSIPVDDGSQVKLTEMDVNWMFCTVLNMKWRDAKEVTDLKERKFLYNKALLMAQSIREQNEDIESKKAEVEQQIRKQVEQMQTQAVTGAGVNL